MSDRDRPGPWNPHDEPLIDGGGVIILLVGILIGAVGVGMAWLFIG